MNFAHTPVTPYSTPLASLPDFVAHMAALDRPVILLEGTRNLPSADRPSLVALGQLLAERLPDAVFRTGGADGADDAFAEGVRGLDPRRIEYVLPRSSHRCGTRHASSPIYSLEAVDDSHLRAIADHTAAASPDYRRLTDYFIHERRDGASAAKTRYLLRDTLKVVGAPALGLRPAAAGIFYVNADDPFAGGTGHTVRVCMSAGIPYVFQHRWRGWLGPPVGADHAG